MRTLSTLLLGFSGDVMAPEKHVFGILAVFAEEDRRTDVSWVEENEQTYVWEDKARVAALSSDGDIQFKALIKPGFGFAKGVGSGYQRPYPSDTSCDVALSANEKQWVCEKLRPYPSVAIRAPYTR